MKSIVPVLLLAASLLLACKTSKPVSGKAPVAPHTPESTSPVNFSEQTSWLLGYFSAGQLTREPHSSWYLTGFDDYTVNTEAINRLLDISKENLSIKIVLGTWCPDSRREVPRFMKVLDIWHFPAGSITFIGVDNMKLSPVGEYDKLDIQRVPTFILYKNNIEAGRIIETPATSLEQDMVNILTRNEK